MTIHYDLPSEDYFKIKAASNSVLKILKFQTPSHHMYREPEQHDTRAMQTGTALHCCVLEPDRFDNHYLVADCDDRRDALYRGLVKDVGDASRVLTRPEHRRVIGMRDSGWRNPQFRRYMESPGRTEVSVTTKDPVTGIEVKCRFDWLGDSLSALDVKKTQDASAELFRKAITNYGYYMQIPFYADVWFWETGERIDCTRDFPIAAFEEKAPHACVLHDLDDVALILGRKHYREALDTYARCLDSGVWPGYAYDRISNTVTDWAANELFEELE